VIGKIGKKQGIVTIKIQKCPDACRSNGLRQKFRGECCSGIRQQADTDRAGPGESISRQASRHEASDVRHNALGCRSLF